MLDKCANPACNAQFRYLKEGNLFEVEVIYLNGMSGDARGTPRNGRGHVERWWLCDECAKQFAPRFDSLRGLVIESSNGESNGVVTAVLQQSCPVNAAEVARVLIRHWT